ncbi:MAG TPA: divalent-cation tolerance protein CutA [Candidatus Acidoferrales bacterium]|nr:divalent-cation tolerance protein CutA [Candidatus Acidoferrales bacterium]
MTDKFVVMVTCGSRAEARRIARRLVGQRLAACVNVIPAAVESVYRWKGKVEFGKEFLLVVKTSRARFAKLQQEIVRLHSYEVPEILALPIARGSRTYLEWLADSVGRVKKS